MSVDKQIEFLSRMLLIRRTEERLLELFSEGLLTGTTHACIGQEANAVGLIAHLQDGDTIFSTHRCHGHYLAFTDDLTGLFAELMGKMIGPSGGRGGSQHLCHVGKRNFFSSGVQGGFLATAAGIAFAEKHKQTKGITVAFIGDGTLGEGSVYEVFNLISLWHLPLLIVIENNRYAQSTPIHLQLAGEIAKRAEAFHLEVVELATFDAEEIYQKLDPLISQMRLDQKPRVVVLNTYRFCSHSKSDDNRDLNEIEQWLVHDPILLLAKRMDATITEQLEVEVLSRIRSSEAQARAAAFPAPLPLLDLDEALVI